MVRSKRKTLMNYKKSEQGITLIVLIVTIVVLLVLAGITIANITRGDGIIEQASNKRDDANIATEKQILSNAVITATNESKLGEITENNLRNALSNKNVDIVKSGGLYRITFKDTNNLYKMNKDGEFFYWEDMQPTDIYAKKDGTVLYLRSTQPDTSYVKGTKWNDSTITKVVIEEPIAPSTCESMFKDCTALEKIENIENLHTENSNNMHNMFYQCSNIKNLNLSLFETSNITTIAAMFYSCQKLQEIDLSSFDTSNVTDMNNLFYDCSTLKTIYISDIFSTGTVQDSGNMFLNCLKLVGSHGTKYDSSKADKEYARIDDPDNETPGYFTLKGN